MSSSLFRSFFSGSDRENVPPFNLNIDRYDQSSYFGRVRRMLDIIDPMTLFASDEKLAEAKRLIDDHRMRTAKGLDKADGVTDAILWDSRKLLEATMHPQTGEKLFFGVRFSFFVPMNLPIVVGMLNAKTPGMQMFWQWYNQTYNVAVNHANRNASNEMTYASIGTAYTAAVTASCGIAWGLDSFVKRSTGFTPATRTMIKSFVPFMAVATAGAANALLMRRNEATEGIEVTDKDGNVVGVSQLAGKRALAQVALSRVVLPIPILVIPPLVMSGLKRSVLKSSSPRVKLITEVALIAACVWLALPSAIGLFPQISPITVADLEERFQSLRDADGQTITKLWYNRGL